MRSALAALALLACDSPPPMVTSVPPPTAVAEPAAQEQVEEGDPLEVRISLTAEDAALRDVARALSLQTGQSVIIGSQVEPVADCLHLTILNPMPVPASRVLDQIRSALASSGVALEVDESELRFVAADGAEPTCPRPRAEERPTADGAPTTTPPAFAAGVRQVSDTEWTITQAAIDAIDELGMTRTARVIPHEENGEVVGIKVYGIRRNSPLGLLGLQNGDLVRTINGRSMADPSAALEAYAAMRGANRIVVALDRRGTPRTHTYRIR